MALVLSGITWILSYRCNLSCQHCFFDVRGPLKVLDHELAHMALSSLTHAEPLAWQHVSGGEPLLFEKELHLLLEVVQASGCGSVGIASNGFWGDSRQRARQTVEQLKRRGVNGVCLSADRYHQQQVPLEYIRTAADQVFKQGLGKHSFVVSCSLAEEELSTGDEPFAIPLAPTRIRKIGKGSSLDARPWSGGGLSIPDGPCRNLCCCLGETSPCEPQMVWIDPYGNVMICYGLIIGNLHTDSLSDILEGYAVSRSPVLATLEMQGPVGLYHLAIDEGWRPEGSFVDECDLCWQARSFLRGVFPETLGPDECYPAACASKFSGEG